MEGQVFDAQSDEFEGLADDGWVDTPAKVVPPAPTAPAPTAKAPAEPAAEPAAEIEEATKTITGLESHRSLLARFAEAGDTLDLDDLLELAQLQGIKGLTRRNSSTNIENAILESMRDDPDVDDEKSD
jgi:hypothetical protein